MQCNEKGVVKQCFKSLSDIFKHLNFNDERQFTCTLYKVFFIDACTQVVTNEYWLLLFIIGYFRKNCHIWKLQNRLLMLIAYVCKSQV